MGRKWIPRTQADCAKFGGYWQALPSRGGMRQSVRLSHAKDADGAGIGNGLGHRDRVALDRDREAAVIIEAEHRAALVLGPVGDHLPDDVVLLADAAKPGACIRAKRLRNAGSLSMRRASPRS